MIIAIDGPAASGKGTLAKRLAAHFGLPHLDTGLLYRATARALLDAGQALDDEGAAVAAAHELAMHGLDEERLRGHAMGEAASQVAAIATVRAALKRTQTAFADRPGGAVLDGRDIGTVIAPHAHAKIFLTASPEARARRRTCEFERKGLAADYATILNEVLARDRRDASRATAPLQAAPDAAVLDTTDLDIEAAFAAALAIVLDKRDRGTA